MQLDYMKVTEAFHRIDARKRNGQPYAAVRGISVSGDGLCFGFWREDVECNDDVLLEVRRASARRPDWLSGSQGAKFFEALERARRGGTLVYGIVKRRGTPHPDGTSNAIAAAPILTRTGKRAPGRILSLDSERGALHIEFDLRGDVASTDASADPAIQSPGDAGDSALYPEAYLEGRNMQILVNAYERDAGARAACITHFGARCRVCEIDFGGRYGDIGEGFIHVHHVRPLAAGGGAMRATDPTRDLVPVCPNCHAMLHRVDPPLSVEALRARLRRS